jgi:putative heme iron utilization protein
MKNMIINHMNKDYSESVKMYAEYFGKEKNVNEAKLLDFNENYMTIEVNNKKIIEVSFRKTVPLEELKDVLIEMSREARKNLQK